MYVPNQPKKVTTEVVMSEHVTPEDVQEMKEVASAVAARIDHAYSQQGYIVTVEGVPRKGEPPAQGNWDFLVTVRKENYRR